MQTHESLDAPYVQYYGPKYGADKEQFWERSDIFVFPTFNEAFGLVAVEAMQHSLPVIATDEGGIPDIIEDGITGYVCPKQNALALAKKLELLLLHSELAKSMGKEGYARYQKMFTLEQFDRTMLDCLKKSMS